MLLAILDIAGIYLIWSSIRGFIFLRLLMHPALLTSAKPDFVPVLLRKHSGIVRSNVCVVLSL